MSSLDVVNVRKCFGAVEIIHGVSVSIAADAEGSTRAPRIRRAVWSDGQCVTK
jgi:hypothetical protein